MSRIDEALKRAGIKARVPGGLDPSEDTLNQFVIAPTETQTRAPSLPSAPRDAAPVEKTRPTSSHVRETQLFRAGAVGRLHPVWKEKLATAQGMRPAAREQYHRLAAVLHQAQADRGVRTVMVTSALAGEGKTLTAANLALTLSETYRRRVLIIDADLRRPTMHEIFQAENRSGLSDGLKSEAEPSLALVEISPLLAVLPAGNPDPNPLGGLTSERMRHVIQEAAETFDWVIVDTPPVVLLADASVLAAMVDIAVLVIQAGRTPYAFIQRAIDAVGRDRIAGLVLNRAQDGVPNPGKNGRDYYATTIS